MRSTADSRQSTGAQELAELLSSARSAVVLTGAGISVPSGIPDFRSPGTGLWEDVDPMEVAHIDAWRRNPDRFWQFYGQRFASLLHKRPNRAHEVVAQLGREGVVAGVITQNIDRLHRLAGTERLVEIHGSIEWSRCMTCNGRVAIDRVVGLLETDADTAPECATCVTPLKPDVVLFGELLPERAMEEAQALAAEADLMVCIGSSLTVHPAAGLPELTRRSGGKIALVTEGETPYDALAEVKLSGDVVAELEAVATAVSDARA